MKDLNLTEEMFLLAVWKLKHDAYGVTIRQYVSRETGRIYPYGTLYSPFFALDHGEEPEIVGLYLIGPDGTPYRIGFALGTLLLSAVLFLFIPRLAAGQIAQANWLPTRLDLGIGGLSLLPGKPSASVSPGIFPSLQDDEALYGRERATLGYTGSLADEPVMHIRSQVSSYWRGLTLERYDGRGWLPSSPGIRLRNESRRELSSPIPDRSSWKRGCTGRHTTCW